MKIIAKNRIWCVAKRSCIATALVQVFAFHAPALADSCFASTGEALQDAQTVRKEADRMSWDVGKLASMAVGNFAKGKKTLYPQDAVEICLQERGGELFVRVRSLASDAGNAEWRKAGGKRR